MMLGIGLVGKKKGRNRNFGKRKACSHVILCGWSNPEKNAREEEYGLCKCLSRCIRAVFPMQLGSHALILGASSYFLLQVLLVHPDGLAKFVAGKTHFTHASLQVVHP